MKVNLYDLFDFADVDDLSKLPAQCIAVNQDDELNERIKAKVFVQIKRPKRMVKIIAIAAIAVVFISSISVLGATYLKPKIYEAPFIEIMEGVDIDSVGKELNLSSAANGLTFVLNQVFSDNSRMLLYFTCPEYKGYTACPTGFDIYANGKKIKIPSVGVGIVGDNIACVSISDLKGISDDMEIKVVFYGFFYINDKGRRKEGIAFKQWSFEFKSFGGSVNKDLRVKPFKYRNETIKPTDFVVSPLGFSFDCVADNEKMNSVSIEIEMKNGTVLSTQKGILQEISSFGYEEHIEYKISGEFQTIINVDEINTIKVFDSIIYS